MKFGFRTPSLKKRIAARTSLKRVVRHNLGFKAPRGMGWFTDPKKAAYNRVYNRTSKGCMVALVALAGLLFSIIILINFLNQKQTHAKKLKKNFTADHFVYNNGLSSVIRTKEKQIKSQDSQSQKFFL